MCEQSVRDKYLFDEIDDTDDGEYTVVDDDVALFNKGFAPLKWKINTSRGNPNRPNNHIDLPTKAELTSETCVKRLKDYFYSKYIIYVVPVGE